jgi:hypothetical protein
VRDQSALAGALSPAICFSRVKQHGALRPPGDVAEVTEQGAFLPFFNLRVQGGAATDGVDEVLEVLPRQRHSDFFALHFSTFVINRVLIAAADDEATASAVDADKGALVLGRGWQELPSQSAPLLPKS